MTPTFAGNRLLAKLPPDELESLAHGADMVSLRLSEPLIEPNKRITHAYFPVNCLASLVTVLEDGSTVEAGSVGREGMAGVPIVLDADETPMQTLIQVAGDAIRVEASRLKEVFDRGGTLKQILNRYVHTLFVVASQSAACNRRHRIEARLARWLLMSSDGIGSNHVAITHEFLATMLGVRRSSVTDTAIELQEQGLIAYQRAKVEILDRSGLEAAACECYEMVRREYERVLA